MRRAKSDFPVGATREAENHKGKIHIWLQERDTIEVWRWSFVYSDGSGYEGDWATSYHGCHQECAWRLHINGKVPRFKRIK